MQVAADVVELQQRRRFTAERLLAQLGRAPGHAERGVQRLLVGAFGQRLERRDVCRRSGRAQQLGPEPRAARQPRARSARPRRSRRSRASLPRSTSATICGSGRNRSSSGSGCSEAQTTASRSHESRQRRTSPAGTPSSACGEFPTSSRARLSSSPRRGWDRAASPRADSASVLAPMPGTLRSRPAAAASAELLGRADVERARQLERALARSGPGSGRARPGPGPVLVRARPARRSRPSRPAPAAVPRSRPDTPERRAPDLSARARRPGSARRGSSRPHGGRPGQCTGWPRPARVMRRTLPGGPRSGGWTSIRASVWSPSAAWSMTAVKPLRAPRARELDRRGA